MKEYKDYAKITAHFDLAIEEAIKFGGDVGKHAVLLFETMRNVLDTVPAADVVEVRHGRWVKSSVPDIYQCSYCKMPTKMDELCDSETLRVFCPNCGAIMDKEE